MGTFSRIKAHVQLIFNVDPGSGLGPNSTHDDRILTNASKGLKGLLEPAPSRLFGVLCSLRGAYERLGWDGFVPGCRSGDHGRPLLGLFSQGPLPAGPVYPKSQAHTGWGRSVILRVIEPLTWDASPVTWGGQSTLRVSSGAPCPFRNGDIGLGCINSYFGSGTVQALVAADWLLRASHTAPASCLADMDAKLVSPMMRFNKSKSRIHQVCASWSYTGIREKSF